MTTHPHPAPRPRNRPGHPLNPRPLWPATPRQALSEATWIATTGALPLLSVVLLLTGTALGIALTPLLLGVLILVGVLRTARLFSGLHRRLAGKLLGLRLPPPPRTDLKPGLGNWLAARLGDRAAWRSVAYLLVRLPFGLVAMLGSGALGLYGLASFSYPLTWSMESRPHHGLPVFNIASDHWLGTFGWGASGAVVLALWPAVVHLLTGVDRLLLRTLSTDPGLRERVRFLEETRATALDDAAEQLRRIERDLHDGAQAQLVAMAMKLGLAKEELATDPVDLDQIRTLVDAAHHNAKQALTELRDLARGIHPAALDKGLGLALSTLASSADFSATVSVELSRRPPPSLETIVYFAAAELMTNASKHGAGRCTVLVEDREDTLRLTVTDHGPGGAAVIPGGGLAGIAERLRPADGELTVSSPAGGPTVVTAALPLPR
ncbi:sensor histidine kinase [Amycolatopsis orientalis]|uniref:sensor histidine kinase n=1 Tax=Amycolatopsis orientalis TaxID=31958 RepID=UPI00039DF03F|nr:sensor histidine kinase [Amycolatopsis orientalis]